MSNASRDDSSLKEELNSLQDIILVLQNNCGLKMPTTGAEWCDVPRTTFDVRRNFVLNDGLREARKSRFDPTKLLNVHFAFESGIDTGGRSREFWRLFCISVVENYCTGDPTHCVFMKSVPSLQNEDFRLIGKMIAMCIV